MGDFIAGIGRSTYRLVDSYLRLSRLLVDTLYWLTVAPLQGRGLRVGSAVRQSVLVGFNAWPIVFFISGLIGFIMALQSALQTKQFGLDSQVPALVAVAMTRELGPLMAAIIQSGRSGSAFAAEIGTMLVQEELDALKTMGLNPIGYLVVPKVLAMLVMQPVLSLIADVAGIAGGWVVCRVNLGMTTDFFISRTIESLAWQDVWTGGVKALVFGLIIAIVGCFYGLNVRGGAEGVGTATTATVVTSIFLVIVADGVFTLAFFLTG